jgi:dihydroorotate dehydrogenase electron transfer subunit
LLADLDDLIMVERASFNQPWPRQLFCHDLARGRTHWFVLTPGRGRRPVAFVNYWVRHDELHILNLATHPSHRRRGYAEQLLRRVISDAPTPRVRYMTLEVRRSNGAAISLYQRLGFESVGVRPRYYVEENEDALVMLLSLPAAGEEVMDQSHDVTSQPGQATQRSSQELPPETLQRCEVRQVRQVSDDLFLVVLQPPQPISAEPGQFAMLKPCNATHHPLLGRPMSILDAGQRLTFLMRRCGEGTRVLTQLTTGDEVDVLLPLGGSWGTPAGGPVVAVAGGVGVAPLLFAARRLAAQGQRMLFLYGARQAKQLVLTEEIAEVAELRLATDDGSQGHHGPVTDLLVRKLGTRPGAEVWTCGPEKMMERVAAVASQYDCSCKVSVEARMACGRGLCLGCAHLDKMGEPRYVCREGPVFDGGEIYGRTEGTSQPPA